MNNKILIIVPAQTKGGVYHYYKSLSKVLNSDFFYYYMDNDKIMYKNKIILFMIHFKRIISLIKSNNFKKIIINPSLLLNSIIRDSFYIFVFKLLNIEVCCFWRGWDINNQKYFRFPYTMISNNFLTVNSMIVLHSGVKTFFERKKYVGNIEILTTIVDKIAFNYKISETNNLNIIFLSRVEIYKGIYELLKIYDIISKQRKNITLTIVGTGSEFSKVKEIIKNKKYNGVSLLGHVAGEKKYKLLSESSTYILPSYSEGMPNSMLEAMAVGLPVITTKVGAMNDFFKDNIMGKFIDIKKIKLSAVKILDLLDNKDQMHRMSRYNVEYAKKHFSDDIVSKNFSNIFLNKKDINE